MSRMLEALKRIEAKQPKPQQEPVEASVNNSLTSGPLQTAPIEAQIESISTPVGPYVVESTQQISILEEELAALESFPLVVKDSFSGPINSTSVAPDSVDSVDVEKTLDQVESAVASALAISRPDIYEEMSRYIIAQLKPDHTAVLLFTNPCDDEGKTEALFSLSKSLTNQITGEVLVVDANLYQPYFTHLWGGSFQAGLGEVLLGYIKWQKVVCTTSADRLSLLPSNRLNSKKTIHNELGWNSLLSQLKDNYQLILVDAPSLAHAQTAAIIPHCDGVYLTVRLGYTKPSMVEQAVNVIDQAGGRLLGSIAIGDKVILP